MTAAPLTWDDLPGESANAIADAERELDTLIGYLDDGDPTLSLSDVADYLINVREYVNAAISNINKGA